jgi:hypothetical protein
MRAATTTAQTLPPPDSGPYSYDGFVPEDSYTDPVFGSVVRRITKDHGKDNLYGRNMCWSADGRRYLHRTEQVAGKHDAWDVIEVGSGLVTHTGIPFGSIAADGGFDAVDPDVLYALVGAELRRIRLQAGGTWVVDNALIFPSPLLEVGGSINWMDAHGRYILVRTGAEPSARVWDLDELRAGPYAGAIDATATVGAGSYLGISPDGEFVVGFDSRPGTGVSGVGQGVSWRIDHAQRKIASAPTVFWSLCGDHGAFCSPSDGRTYFVTYNCYSHPGLWRVDVSNNADGLDEQGQMALPHNAELLRFTTWQDFGHVSAVARGPRSDWVFVSTEDAADEPNGPTIPWHPYRQEILAVHVLSGEVQRLAHHRSRFAEDYQAQPRVSCSWEGDVVGWASNYNRPGVVDVFGIPFSPAPEPGPEPPATLPVTIQLGDRRFVGTVSEQ